MDREQYRNTNPTQIRISAHIIKREKLKNKKYWVWEWKPIPFSWRFWVEMKQKWSSKWVTRSVWERNSWERKWVVTKVRGKTEKDFKNCRYCAKHAFFAAKVSRQIYPPKHFKPKVLKNFLSVFHDWKSHSRGSRELSRENLYVPLATGPSTCEQVAKTDPRSRDCGMRLDWPATESQKQGNTGFFKFSVFEEQNTFQKQLKHSKIFLCLNQQRLSMWKHILSSTITQMNMAFIEHKLVCCVWVSTMR